MKEKSKLDAVREDPFSLPPGLRRVVYDALLGRLTNIIEESNRDPLKLTTEGLQRYFDYLGIDPTRGKSLDEMMDALRDKYGLWSVDARRVAEVLTRPRIGTPASAREQAIFAYELRLHDPKFRWWMVADRLCDCPLKSHKGQAGKPCIPRLRLAVYDLKNFLRELKIDL